VLAKGEVTVLFTGDLFGQATPIPGRGGRNLGGLARNAHVVNSIRNEESPVILVDSGGIFSKRYFSRTGETIADIMLKAMNNMGYTAISISPGEFSFGADFLRKQASHLSVPLVASNLLYAEGVPPFTEQYVIVQAEDRKVAILGVIPPGMLGLMPRSGATNIVEVIPPEEALASLLPEIKKEADIVILLSQLGLELTEQLVDTVTGIDMAIYGGKDNAPPKCRCGGGVQASSVGNERRIPIFKANAKGTHLGYIQLSLDDAGHVSVDAEKMLYLDETVQMNEEILAITGYDIHIRANKEMKKEAERQQRELEQLQKLTPEQYIQKLLREQQEREIKQ